MGQWKNISVNQLITDEENPRFEAVSTEDEALFSILDDQSLASGNKILNLAKSIAADGLNASEFLVVSPVEESGTFRVREGNRRFTAIKMSLCPDCVPEGFIELKDQFAELTEAMREHEFVNCYVTDDEEEIRRILALRHGGENGGVGVVKWNSAQKARFSQEGNQQSVRGISLVESIRNRLGEGAVLTIAADIPPTNIGRLISTPEVRDALNIDVEGNNASYLGGQDGMLLDVFSTIHRYGVAPIYRKEDRLHLIAEAKRRIEPNSPSQMELPLSEHDNGVYSDNCTESMLPQEQISAKRDSLVDDSVDERHQVFQEDACRSLPNGALKRPTVPRRKPVSHSGNEAMFNGVLRPKGARSNDIYRAIDWIDKQYLRKPDELGHLLPVLGFSLRLLIETVAREYYQSLGMDPGDNALSSFMKDIAKPIIKENLNAIDRNSYALASEWIDGQIKFEALFAKWAHGTLPADRSLLVRQSKLVALIINEVWT